jgi:imidazolonepropionase-like amidohydrolase
MPIWGDAFLEISTRDKARHYVDEWKSLGADFIKLYASLPWYLKTAAAEEAHRQGMPAVGHGLSVEEITRSVNLGFETLEHEGPLNDDTLKLMHYAGVKLDPTLTIGAGTGLMLSGPNPKGIDAKFRKYVPAETIVDSSPFGPISPPLLASWCNTLHTTHKGRDVGVEMLDGTDALMTAIYFGPSVHWEFQFFEDAGISKAYILRMATLGAAETEGASADLGAIEPGKIGDVLLLDKNPLDEISNT